MEHCVNRPKATLCIAERNANIRELLRREFAREGYGVYRANTAFAEKVAATYGPVKRDVERRLKRALDPNNIIAPGRCGISI